MVEKGKSGIEASALRRLRPKLFSPKKEEALDEALVEIGAVVQYRLPRPPISKGVEAHPKWRPAVVTNTFGGSSVLNLTVFLDGLNDRSPEDLTFLEQHGLSVSGKAGVVFVGSASAGDGEGCWRA